MTETAVYAGGGVVWRLVDDKVRVLLIHRTRYRDVTLPKGKVDPGEMLAETAVREIFEETVYKDQHVRTLAWLLLDEEQGRSLRHEYPTIDALRARVGDDPAARTRLMAAFTMVYGWTVFGPQLLEAFGWSPDDRAENE